MAVLPISPRSLAILIALSAVLVTPAEARIKPKKLAPVPNGPVSVAMDPSGAPHVVYQDSHYRPVHARYDGKAWVREQIDPLSDSGFGRSIAIDAQGGLHVSFGAYRGAGMPKLVYAFDDGSGWQLLEPGPDGTNTRLRLDSFGQPHILYSSGATLQHAWRDGAGWHVEETGFPSGPYPADFALDGEDHLHVAWSQNSSGLFYGTNRSGGWTSELLAAGDAAPAAIAVDGDQVIRVAAGMSGEVREYALADGGEWSNRLIVNPADTNNAPVGGIALALDAGDRAHLLVTLYLGVNVCFYIFDDGLGWSGAVLDAKNAGFTPAIILDGDGVAFATWVTALIGEKGNATAKWSRIPLPDLAGTWNGVELGESDGSTSVAGTLTIGNAGLQKSPNTTVTLLISDDAALDEGDTIVPTSFKVAKIAPEGSLEVPVQFRYAGPIAGRYLIAVIDPERLGPDRNMLDNVVPVLLGP